MQNKQKMQIYDYFVILYFKDRSDRDQTPRSRPALFWIVILRSDRDRENFWIAIAIRSRTPTLSGENEYFL
jgi:hypothetical protein